MARIRLTLAYEGTRYAGWQLQSGQRTVQGELERVLGRIMGAPVRVQGSGRTDAGVHALGQVAHFDIPHDKTIPWLRAMNAHLPDDIRVLDAAPVVGDFHARFGARGKTYAYSLWLDRDRVLPQRRRYVWPCGPINLEQMDQAAAHLVGEHDFSAFQNTGTDVGSTVREVTAITREPGPHSEEVVWRFTATGFLKQMVRNMMGCLVEVGRGKLAPEAVSDLLDRRDRTRAPASAPARGLTLERVEY